MDKEHEKIYERIDGIAGTLDGLVIFLKENMVTKAELRSEIDDAKAELKGDISDAKSELREEIASKEDLGRVKHDLLVHLDKKFAEQKGELTLYMRNKDAKLDTLVEILKSKEVLSPNEARDIVRMSPFPNPQL